MIQERSDMSFKKIFYLRFMDGLSTLELEKLFPNEKRKICMVALCSLPDQTLYSVLRRDMLRRVLKVRNACFKRWHLQSN